MFFNKLADVCHELLYNDNKLFQYLKNRGISATTIKKYKIGAFPHDLRILFDKISADELLQHGIIWNASNSPFKFGANGEVHYPVVMPIRNIHGNTIAIGCRTLLSEEKRKKLEQNLNITIPKYKNTEYKKTAHLYGLEYAVEEIRKKDKVFVVEGYFDAISSHQSSILNVVATCGTLFSTTQLIILSRYTDNICLLFDNDAAGRLSAARIMKKFEEENTIKANLSCKFTPKGFKDVDEYLRAGGSVDFFDN